jgi:hypothetical protein
MVSTRSASAALAAPRRPAPTTRGARAATTSVWTHTPTSLSLIWLAVSVPLVFWDMLYVFLRPHSMPGGSLHWPVWSAYAIQAELDYTYGFKKWNEGDGWNAAQSAVNMVESVMYLVYLGLWYKNKGKSGELKGRVAAVGVLVLYTAVVTTVGKTVLYCEYYCLLASPCCVYLVKGGREGSHVLCFAGPRPMCYHQRWVVDRNHGVGSGFGLKADIYTLGLNEAFSGFANIGHNAWPKLITLWVIPK